MSETKLPVILVVDDEEMILTSIKASFAIDAEYEFLTYTSPVAALQDLDKKIKNIDLVISDYLMPQMDGITFLGNVKQRFPLAPRILLTGYADKESAVRAINNVGLYQYIEKPWDNDELKLIIHNALEKAGLIQQLQEKIREVAKVQKELRDVQKDILRVFV
jgi:DNA-binding NtrC family response regulator